MIVLPPVKVTTPPMSPTKSNMHPLQIVSQGYAHLPTRHIQKTPNQGFWCSEVRRLRIRFVRQDWVCVHSDVFGSSLLIRVCFFNDSGGSTLHIFMYVSFVHAVHFTTFRIHHSFIISPLSPGSRLFLFGCKSTHLIGSWNFSKTTVVNTQLGCAPRSPRSRSDETPQSQPEVWQCDQPTRRLSTQGYLVMWSPDLLSVLVVDKEILKSTNFFFHWSKKIIWIYYKR